MIRIIAILAFALIITNVTEAQLYQGPANGSVPTGVIVNIETFLLDMSGENISPYVKRPRNEVEIKKLPDYLNTIPSAGPEGSNYTEMNTVNVNNPPLLLKKFPGAQDAGVTIPPDTYLAAGPTHIMGVDNSRFYIWTKGGDLVRSITANTWFASTLSGADAFDPKVSYDHFSKRWIMVWLDQNDATARGYFLISVSDDSVPTGTWYNWAIKSSLNGSAESNSWGDYQGVGFDNQAIYITTNQFAFTGSYVGSKIRIVGKSQLYNNTAGPCAWTDMWDVRDPGNTSFRSFGIRPSIIYGTSGQYYFLNTGPFSTGTYLSLYKLTNPLTAPVLTGVNIPVITYSDPPSANQLGGSAIPIESGGSDFRNEPTYRNGFLYSSHSVATDGGSYSGINYTKIDVNSNTALEDASFGETGFWHFYPALAIDKDMNIAMTFSRSGLTEYIGAYYNTRLSTDPPGTFSGITALKTGEANYVKDFGSGRNRWGDYMGIWLDPSDENNIWMHTEYAKFPSSTWANQVGLIRMIPYATARIFSDRDSLTFGNREVGTVSDTQNVILKNYGNTTLTISNIQMSGTEFRIINSPSLPLNLAFNDSLKLKVNFLPGSAGFKNDSLKITSNDVTNPGLPVYLKAKGYVISPVAANVIYGVTGASSNGLLVTINPSSGAGTSVGPSGFTQLNGASIRPSNNNLYASITGNVTTQLVRINVNGGDAYLASLIPIPNIRSIAFDLNDDLYCSSTDGKIYKYNVTSRDTLTIGNSLIPTLYGLSVNPLNGQLWGISAGGNVYKINKQTAASQLVGSTTQSLNVAIGFDKTGKLYGLKGIGIAANSLITIDTVSGAGTLIGFTGISSVNALAISPEIIGIENNTVSIPKDYSLYQNYPNPFNPSTKIKFDLPNSSNVKLYVYDMLGREVAKLVDSKLDAGSYSYNWDASSYSSGIYFYRIETSSQGGASNFVSTKKMLLVK